jgi:zinc protease
MILVFLFTAAASLGADKLDVKEHFLDNGMKVIILEDHSAPLAAVIVSVNAGSKNEPAGESGTAHLVEHMMFKGSTHMGAEQFTEIVQRYGGDENAGTERDFTDYFAYIPSSKVEEILKLYEEIMSDVSFRPDEFLSERDVVLEELRLGLNDPYDAVFDAVTAGAYEAHPYRRPITGWISDLRTLTRDEAYSFYKTFYVPNNMRLLLVGDITENEAMRLAKEYFGKIKKSAAPPTVPTVEPEQTGERRIKIEREAFLPMVTMAWHIPAASDSDLIALKVLDQILSGGRSSRLHKELVYEKQICTSVSAWNYELKDPGLFYITCMVSKGHTAEEAENGVYGILGKLKSEPVTDTELKKASNQYLASFVFGQESILSQAFIVEYYDAFFWLQAVNELPQMIRSVTKEQVMRVASEYLTEENRTVGVLVPTPPVEPPSKMPGAMDVTPHGVRR